jgi:hypothetical protein
MVRLQQPTSNTDHSRYGTQMAPDNLARTRIRQDDLARSEP